ncbi:hypothetical protein GUJ93_ZPchr0009g208 [Zizania palustris]|uniref:B30.2/SPRY domain-containing protein n=1 Tax=Zizania palustris TaxID=103762 RepID=A0A8J5S615_ZIZPA|nr:hypothetical protein GUJ93_ZPchr0009g208 [Zizania palustris]
MKHMTFAAPVQPTKKSKKNNSNSVWTRPASCKGKKKGKHPTKAIAGGNSVDPGGIIPKPSIGEDEFVLNPSTRHAASRSSAAMTPDWPVLLSRVFKSDRIEISDDRLTAGSTKGYRMVRATRGVAFGAWYFEVKVLHLGPNGHTRLGCADVPPTMLTSTHSLATMCLVSDTATWMVATCNVHKACLRTKYSDQGYGEGDVVGFYIHLPYGELYEPKQPFLVHYKGLPFHAEAPKLRRCPIPIPVPY